MLLNLLQSLRRRTHGRPAAGELPQEREARLKSAFERAPVDRHRDILYGPLTIGERPLNELLAQCLRESRAGMRRVKSLHRPLSSYFLMRYFLHALALEGACAECGVFLGTSALLMCRAAQTRDAGYKGDGLHLIDSFEGLSEPTAEDRFAASAGDGSGAADRALPKGWLSAPLEHARATLRDFPRARFHKGWIPDVFAGLPPAKWSFVHLDLDLYAPTLASLRYFYPRLTPGGVIVCDDYGAPLFPGAHRAWDTYCEEHGAAYVVLDTGQSAILKT